MTKKPASPTPPQPRRRRWLIWIGGLLAVCLLSTVGIGFGGWLALRQRFADLPDTHDLDTRLATEAQAYLADRPNGALVIGVVQDGRTAVFGFGAMDDGSAPDADTVYEIGSISKVLTGLTLAALVSDGTVAITDTLGSLVESTTSDYSGGNRASPAIALITLQHLVTHTSGLPRLPQSLSDDELAGEDPYAAYDSARLWQDLRTAQLENAPGLAHLYSNYGAGVLGQTLAQTTGQDYAALVAERILKPLTLSDTVVELTDAQRDRLAPGHVLGSNASAPNWTLNALAPAGGFKSTARDLTDLIAANLTAATGSRPIDRALLESHAVLYSSWDVTMAYGWFVQDQLWGQRVLWHNGGTGGYTSYIAIDFEHQAGIVLLSNYGDAMAGDNDLDALGLVSLPLIARVSLP